MSRSRRKPYSAVCGGRSSHVDKTIAARSFRRTEKKTLKNLDDPEEYVHPVRYEASANDVWGWSRDGKQTLQFPPDENEYLHRPVWEPERWTNQVEDRWIKANNWYEKLKRK